MPDTYQLSKEVIDQFIDRHKEYNVDSALSGKTYHEFVISKKGFLKSLIRITVSVDQPGDVRLHFPKPMMNITNITEFYNLVDQITVLIARIQYTLSKGTNNA